MITNGPSRDVPLTNNYWEVGKFLEGKYNVHFTQISTDMLLHPNPSDESLIAAQVVQMFTSTYYSKGNFCVHFGTTSTVVALPNFSVDTCEI